MLDGTVIPPSERIQAIQAIPELETDLLVAIEMAKIEKEKKRIINENKPESDKTESYSRENRKEMYLQMSN
jgi:hypothetical protein